MPASAPPPPTTPLLGAWRARAAEGTPEAMFKLAGALIGHGQYEEAFDCYGRAAAAGHAGAQVQLARMLLYGITCDADPARAVHWLLRAEAEANDVTAGYLLAMIALGGVALPRDAVRINRRFLAALQADHPSALRAAAVHFGRRPDAGEQARCVQLLERASQRGDVVA